MKLLSTSNELRAVKSICESPSRVGSLLLAALQKDHFQYPPAKEAFAQIRKHAREYGELPDWETVCSEPNLDVTTRRILRSATIEPLQVKQKVDSLVSVLDKYRKLRVLLSAGKEIMDSISSDKANPDVLLESVGSLLSSARVSSESKQSLYNFGVGNNSSNLLKELLYGKAPPMVPTGFKAYDERNGGFLNGSLVLIGANTGGGKCLIGSSLVPTTLGLLTLEELHDSDHFGFVPKNIGVCDIHGGAVTDATYSDYGVTWSVETTNGDFAEGLPDHKFFTPHGFKKISDLQPGDWLAKPIKTGIFPKEPTNVFQNKLWTTSLALRAAQVFIRGSSELKGAFKTGLPLELRTARETIQTAFCAALKNAKVVRSSSRNKLLMAKAMCENCGFSCSLQFKNRGSKSHKPEWQLHFNDPSLVLPLKIEFIAAITFARLVNVADYVKPKLLDIARLVESNGLRTEYILWSMDLIGSKDSSLDRFLELSQWEWTQVKRIQVCDYKRVFDLSVPASRTYCVQGLLSHNTSMAVNLMRNMSEFYGKNCALVSLEMSAEQMLARLKAILTGISRTKISLRRLTANERLKVKNAYKSFVLKLKESNTRFSIYTPMADGLEEILYSLQPYGYDVILIDYVSLLKEASSSGEKAQWENLGGITKFAKRYAEKHNVIIVLLVQVSKEGLVRYSRTMVEDANHCWVWIAPSEESEILTLDVQQLKARNLEKFPFQLALNTTNDHIYDIDASSVESDTDNTDAGYTEDLNDDRESA